MSESAKSKARPGATSDREEGQAFEPKFGADGLATCVTIDASHGDVLMVAHMNDGRFAGDARDRNRPLLVALARRSVAQGRHVRPNPDAGRNAGRLRSGRLSRFRHRGGRRRSVSHRPAILLLPTRRARRRYGSARVHRTFAGERLMARPAPASPRGSHKFTLIVWRHLARKLKFLVGRRTVGSFSDRLRDVQSGLSQN